MKDAPFTATIRHNCDISDARDNGIYSICSLVLKLRNLYKWEHGIEPWAEPETAILLDWIEAKENYWETIASRPYQTLAAEGREIDPYDHQAANELLSGTGQLYGAGYGRAMKSVFFLADIVRQESVEGCPVYILGREIARELASPFAMLQDNTIIIRRESLRFFFWDHIQEIRSSAKSSLQYALRGYGIMTGGCLNQALFRDRLDPIVDAEIPIFIYHEIGEKLQEDFDTMTLRKIIAAFPESVIEYTARAVKDVLADTHPRGMLDFIVRERREASLGFYVGFLAGLRRELFPEIIRGFNTFCTEGDWGVIEQARRSCRENVLQLAGKIQAISSLIDREPHERVKRRFSDDILAPLGLDVPETEESRHQPH